MSTLRNSLPLPNVVPFFNIEISWGIPAIMLVYAVIVVVVSFEDQEGNNEHRHWSALWYARTLWRPEYSISVLLLTTLSLNVYSFSSVNDFSWNAPLKCITGYFHEHNKWTVCFSGQWLVLHWAQRRLLKNISLAKCFDCNVIENVKRIFPCFSPRNVVLRSPHPHGNPSGWSLQWSVPYVEYLRLSWPPACQGRILHVCRASCFFNVTLKCQSKLHTHLLHSPLWVDPTNTLAITSGFVCECFA